MMGICGYLQIKIKRYRIVFWWAMNTLFFKKNIFFFRSQKKPLCFALFFILLVHNILFASVCPIGTKKDIQEIMNKQEIEKILFFSSWCFDCKKELSSLKNLSLEEQKKILIVHTFIRNDTTDKILSYFEVPSSILCYRDIHDEIRHFLNVKYVPFVFYPKRESVKIFFKTDKIELISRLE